jgi:hypothetical protein
MTCEEFVRVLPQLGDGSTLDREAHLHSCSACSNLVADLQAISIQAAALRGSDDPSPRVWKSIEAVLRSEGLIHSPAQLDLALQNQHLLEDESHVRSCAACANVLADLDAISQQARLLQDLEEPSPRVWNSIEIELRHEGLIRPLPVEPSPRQARPRWRLGWLVPITAAVAIFGTVMLQNGGGWRPIDPGQPQERSTLRQTPEEAQLMSMIADRGPALRAAYASDLKVVDSYIDQAEESVHANPQDDVAQQYLRNAYEQKAMIYEMAMNRPLQ